MLNLKKERSALNLVKQALFLDRDGVINVNHGYVHTKENFQFIENIFELVRNANSAGYLVVVITNQSGIGRGFYSEDQFLKLSDWMCEQFHLNGAIINKIYFSPFHPTEGVGKYLLKEDTRKPGPGMILQAKRDLELSLKESILVGDKPSDIEAGIAAGVGTNILYSNDMRNEIYESEYLFVNSLLDICNHFKKFNF